MTKDTESQRDWNQKVEAGCAVAGVAVFSGARVNAAINGPTVDKNRVFAFIPIPLRTSSDCDERVAGHVHANDLGAVVREDSECLGHGRLAGHTRLLKGGSVRAVVAPAIAASTRLARVASQSFTCHIFKG